jgi:hypothetical protein
MLEHTLSNNSALINAIAIVCTKSALFNSSGLSITVRAALIGIFPLRYISIAPIVSPSCSRIYNCKLIIVTNKPLQLVHPVLFLPSICYIVSAVLLDCDVLALQLTQLLHPTCASTDTFQSRRQEHSIHIYFICRLLQRDNLFQIDALSFFEVP